VLLEVAATIVNPLPWAKPVHAAERVLRRRGGDDDNRKEA
jgi:hypothetical protein